MRGLRVLSRTRRAAARGAGALPRYRGDNVFDTSKFTARFPGFRVTTYREGVETIPAV